jgi:hypothetical protein
MTVRINPMTILDQVAHTLVVKHRYANLEDAYWGMALSAQYAC